MSRPSESVTVIVYLSEGISNLFEMAIEQIVQMFRDRYLSQSRLNCLDRENALRILRYI